MCPTVLNTRPDDGAAAEFSALLEDNGYTVLHAPMLRIESLPCDMPDKKDTDAVAFTSLRGVRFCDTDRSLPVFTVGDRTAAAAQQAGFSDVTSAGGDLKVLAALIGGSLRPGARLAHIRGYDTTGDLGAALEKYGISVTPYVSYRAYDTQEIPEGVRTAMRAGEVDAAAFFSVRTVLNFVRLATELEIAQYCSGIVALCLSENVATMAAKLGWNGIISASEPTADAMLSALDMMKWNTG